MTEDRCACGAPRPTAPPPFQAIELWRCGWCGRIYESNFFTGCWVEFCGPSRPEPWPREEGEA
ncbi:hypothetical protein HRbin12_01626 [bacterium HR12]|nr:hypothetical protein HRbin12_01626 [bacterium HR12]